MARNTAEGVFERRLTEAKGREAPVYPLRSPSEPLVVKRVVPGMPRVVPIEPAAPAPMTPREQRKHQARLAREAVAEKRRIKKQKLEELRAAGHHGVNPDADDKDVEEDGEGEVGGSEGGDGGGSKAESSLSVLRDLYTHDTALESVPLTSEEAEDPWAIDGDDPLDVPDWAARRDTWFEVWGTDILGNDIANVKLDDLDKKQMEQAYSEARAAGMQGRSSGWLPTSLRDLRADRAVGVEETMLASLREPSSKWRTQLRSRGAVSGLAIDSKGSE